MLVIPKARSYVYALLDLVCNTLKSVMPLTVTTNKYQILSNIGKAKLRLHLVIEGIWNDDCPKVWRTKSEVL
jgi:hypothetical protein